MKKGLSQTTFPTGQLPHRGQLLVAPQSHTLAPTQTHMAARKIEGFDQKTASQSYPSKIEKIKNRPKQETIEQEYVKGLQDEIHYLEMELRLLKEKESAKHSHVDQLETFFGDGIAINENILGMKNSFNSYKTQSQNEVRRMLEEKKEREALLAGLGRRVQELSEAIARKEEEYRANLSIKANQTHETEAKRARVKKQIENHDEVLRAVRKESRSLREQISAEERNKEIYSISKLKHETHKHSKLDKIRESVEEKEKELDNLQEQFESFKKQEEDKSYVIVVEEDNLRLKKKIIGATKELNCLQEKINDKKLQLEQKLKERQKEINARVDMQTRLENNKSEVQRENGLSAEELDTIVKDRELKFLQQVIDKNAKLSKYIEHYRSLLAKVEDNIQQLGEKRPELKSELTLCTNESAAIEKEIEVEKNRQYQLCEAVSCTSGKLDYLKDVIPMVTDRIKKNNQQIAVKQAERQRLDCEIKPKQKQLQLIGILKSLNFEQVQICSSSNNNIQEVLIDLMRNWETLSRK